MADAHPSIGGLPLVLGGNVFGWTLDRDGSFVVLDAFYEAGGRMIDTAEGYTSFVPGNKGGESETILGEWMELRGIARGHADRHKDQHVRRSGRTGTRQARQGAGRLARTAAQRLCRSLSMRTATIPRPRSTR